MALTWTPKEWLNQLAHFALGILFFIVSFFVLQFFMSYQLAIFSSYPIVGLIAFSIEVYQYYKKDNRELKLDDRFRDWCFYMVGAAVAGCGVIIWI